MTGAHKKLNFPITKSIKLSHEQADRWDTQAVKTFLDNGTPVAQPVEIINTELREITEVMLSYREKFNKLIEMIENSELGTTKLITNSSIKFLEAVERW